MTHDWKRPSTSGEKEQVEEDKGTYFRMISVTQSNHIQSISFLTRDSHLRQPAPTDCGCSTRPVKANTEHKWQLGQDAQESLPQPPGLLGGRSTNVPIFQSGMAIIWKLHMNPPSGMHSLPAPNADSPCHPRPPQKSKTQTKNMKQQCIKQHELKTGICTLKHFL